MAESREGATATHHAEIEPVRLWFTYGKSPKEKKLGT